MEFWEDSHRCPEPFVFFCCYRVYSMLENTIEPTLSNARRHSDVTSVTYAHFTYFTHVNPQKVWNIGKIAMGARSLL